MERNTRGLNGTAYSFPTRRSSDWALEGGWGDDDLTVETARTEEGGVEHVGGVGRRDDDDAFVGFEAVHLDEQLVERLLALVVAVAEPGAAMAADRVDFVDEDDARRVALGLFEHVAEDRKSTRLNSRH